jgi:hypothetical protein
MPVRVAEVGKQVKMEGEGNACRAHLTFLFPARTNFGPPRGFWVGHLVRPYSGNKDLSSMPSFRIYCAEFP